MATSPLNGPPVRTIDEAIDRMEAVRDHLPKRNGVACFNLLYLEVTVTVKARLPTGFFADPAFIDHLDVVFANRYLSALRSWEDRRTAPKCWKVLIERQHDRCIHPAQFAVAGMNAHINFDLAFSLIDTCRARGEDIDTGRRRADFDKVNEIFVELEPELRRRFQPEFFDPIDRDLPDVAKVEDLLVHFSIVRARDQAWEEAQLMDDLSGVQAQLAMRLLDRLVGAFGQTLLLRV